MCIDIIPIFSLFSFDVVNSVCLVVILSSVVKYILNRKLDLISASQNCKGESHSLTLLRLILNVKNFNGKFGPQLSIWHRGYHITHKKNEIMGLPSDVIDLVEVFFEVFLTYTQICWFFASFHAPFNTLIFLAQERQGRTLLIQWSHPDSLLKNQEDRLGGFTHMGE